MKPSIPINEFENITALRGFNNIYFIKFFQSYMKLIRLYNKNICENKLTHDQEDNLEDLLIRGKVKLNNMLKLRKSEVQYGSYQIKGGTPEVREEIIKK